MASGIIEKSNNGLFDNEIEINGKYATMARYLKEDVGIFATFREAYLTAAIIGLLNNAKETKDSSEKVQAASIFPNELSKRKADLKLIYRIIMLVEENPDYTIEDYMNRAFRDDAEEGNRDKLKANMALFNSYACGGLEVLYNKFQNLSKTDDIVDALYDYIHTFGIDVGLLDEEESLPDFEVEDN